jgi:preprotein translocase subunit YajC
VTIPALSDWLLLAQEATEPAAEAAADAANAPAPPGLSSMLPALVGIMVLFYFLILRPQKSKDQQFRSMVDNLKEKDRVVTIGGIHGVVTNVQREAGIVTIRIDESTGTKIRVGASAIAKVVVDDEVVDSGKTAS